MKPPFERWDFSSLATELAGVLERRGAVAQQCAGRLGEPHAPLARFAVTRYENPNSTRSGLTSSFDVAFGSWDGFVAALRDAAPAALEAALEILSRVDAEAAVPFAAAFASAQPWHELGRLAGVALARSRSSDAVAAMLAHLDVYGMTFAIKESACATAGAPVAAALEAALATAKPDRDLVAALAGHLGRHRFAAAWPMIAALYDRDDHRLGAGHALLAYGDPRSLELLAAGAERDDRWSRFFAVRALLARDPARVVAALGGVAALVAPSRRALAATLLEEADRVARAAGTLADRELVDVALTLIRDPDAKDAAQSVLDVAGDAIIKSREQLMSASGKPAKRPTKRQLVAMRATIENARTELESIVADLRAAGYAFQVASPLPPRVDREPILAAIEEALGGPLPASLRWALALLGGSDLRGRLAGDADAAVDPFMLVAPEVALEQARDEGGGTAPLSLVIAPDAVGKAGLSGGQQSMLVPDVALDGRVFGADGEPMFTDWLLRAIESARKIGSRG